MAAAAHSRFAVSVEVRLTLLVKVGSRRLQKTRGRRGVSSI